MKPIGGKKLLLSALILLIVSLMLYWAIWTRGSIMAETTTSYGIRFVLREIPPDKSLLAMVLGLNDSYFYRMERWRVILTDCSTFSGDSYRAQTGKIEVADTETVFILDDERIRSYTSQGLWLR